MIRKEAVTLTIKKKFFDLILANKKLVEYREYKDFYVKKFTKKDLKILRLHYQQYKMLEVEVLTIELVKTPKHITMFNSKHCFKITLKKNTARLV